MLATTTGETTDALREFFYHGVKTQEIVSLGQAEMRKVISRDIERLADKLGPPGLHAEVAVRPDGQTQVPGEETSNDPSMELPIRY